MFFERGSQSSTRHRRLRYLLLLALRCSLVFLVVLAFANPFLRRATADANSRLLLIVLDNSFSMRAGKRFADAKTLALAALSARPHAQKAQIMSLGGQVDVRTQATSDDAQLRAALQSVQPGDGHANFGELGQAIRTLAETVHGPVELRLVSDMQRTAMPANFADAALPRNVELVLQPVVNAASPNWTIENVDAPASLSDPKDPKQSRVRAVVAGFSTPAATKNVSLLINGKTLATRKVDVPGDGRAAVEFAPLDVAYGFNRCEVRIEGGDAFPADDARVFVVRRSDPERVLFVHAPTDTRSALYFGSALSAACAVPSAEECSPACNAVSASSRRRSAGQHCTASRYGHSVSALETDGPGTAACARDRADRAADGSVQPTRVPHGCKHAQYSESSFDAVL